MRVFNLANFGLIICTIIFRMCIIFALPVKLIITLNLGSTSLSRAFIKVRSPVFLLTRKYSPLILYVSSAFSGSDPFNLTKIIFYACMKI